MTTLREWKERRPASDLKQTVEFYHPAFGYYRLVNNLFNPASFGGNEYQPSSFTIVEPAQDGTATISMTATFAFASQEVKTALKSWRGAARMIPINFKYQIWELIGDATALKTYSMYVKEVAGESSNVTVSVGMTNPLSVANPIIYTTQYYPGLRTI